MNSKKIAKNLILLLEHADFWRPSNDKLYFRRVNFHETIISQKLIKRLNSEFGNETDSFFNSYRMRVVNEILSPKNLIMLMIIALSWLSIIFIFSFQYKKYYTANFLIEMSVGLIIFFIVFFPLLVTMGKKIKNTLGRGHEPELKSQAQKIIDYTKNFLKENNIDPKDFPIKVAHNDYQGLTYKKKGGTGYLAYVNIRDGES